MSHWETKGASDEWYTPKYVFDALGEAYDLDVASPPHRTNVPCARAIYAGSLNNPWPKNCFIWGNFPFGGRNGLVPWLDQFFAHGNGIALTPDRTSTPWFRDAWLRADLVLFTPKIRFFRPNGTNDGSPSNGTALWATGERAARALERAAGQGLGILAQPLRIAA